MALTAVGVLVVVGGIFFFYNRSQKANVLPPGTPSNEPIGTIVPQAPSQAEKDEVEKNKTQSPTDKRDDDKDTPAPAPAPAPPPATSTNVQITSAKQDGDNVVIQTALYGNGWSNCTLTVSNGSTKTYDAAVLYQETFSTCMGFAVPKGDLPAGNWTATLRATNSDGNIITSESKTVNVQ